MLLAMRAKRADEHEADRRQHVRLRDLRRVGSLAKPARKECVNAVHASSMQRRRVNAAGAVKSLPDKKSLLLKKKLPSTEPRQQKLDEEAVMVFIMLTQ